MRYVVIAACCGGLAAPALAEDMSKRLTEMQLDGVFAGQSAAAGAGAIAAGSFILSKSGTGAGVTSNTHGVRGATTTGGIASGQAYGVGLGGGSAAASGAATSARGNIVFTTRFGQSGTVGGTSYSTTTSASIGAICIYCP